MVEFKRIKEDTDFTQLKMSKYKWDVFCNGQSFDLYRIEDYYHSSGGRWGDNCYWICPMGEKPTYENLIQFSGEACCWSFTVTSKNYIKSKWGDTEMRHNYSISILRNNQEFYTFGANNMDWGISKARQLLFEVSEHAISFNERGFENDIVGRKIYWREQPAVIRSYSMCGNLCIEPAGDSTFSAPSYADDEFGWNEGETDIAEDLFTPSINWFRSKLVEGEII